MGDLGTREWGALGMLLVAILVAATFYLPGSDNGPALRPISLGEVPPGTGTPREEPTVGPDGVYGVVQPATWVLTYRADGQRERVAAPALDIAFSGAPAEGFPASGWQLFATGTTTVPRGPQRIVLTHDCDLRVLIDGEVVFTAGATGEPQRAVITFDQPRRRNVRIEIEATKGDGPFLLRWERP
jgi:hypothetical protein